MYVHTRVQHGQLEVKNPKPSFVEVTRRLLGNPNNLKKETTATAEVTSDKTLRVNKSLHLRP